jgi:hypothetical protein
MKLYYRIGVCWLPFNCSKCSFNFLFSVVTDDCLCSIEDSLVIFLEKHLTLDLLDFLNFSFLIIILMNVPVIGGLKFEKRIVTSILMGLFQLNFKIDFY